MSILPPYHLRHITRLRQTEKIPSDWPCDVKERWYPLFRLLKSSYFTELDVARLIAFKAGVIERGQVGLNGLYHGLVNGNK
jgi:hypothetical protein